MIKLFYIFLFLLTFSTIQAQSLVEIGMSKDEILQMNNDTCFSDTLDIGTPFIKALTSDKRNYIYYFFDNNICFSVIIYFENKTDALKFRAILDSNYTKNKELWVSDDKKYFIYYEVIEDGAPIFYLWSDKIKYPQSWDFLEDYKR